MTKLVNILLQKSQSEYPWGFTLGSGAATTHNVHITWVDDSSLASEHLEAGDRVLEIDGMDASILSEAEIGSLLCSPSKKLELLIMKKHKPIADRSDISRFYTAKVHTSEVQQNHEEHYQSLTEDKTNHQSGNCVQSSECFKYQKNETNGKLEEVKVDKFWTRPPPDLEDTIMKQTSLNNNFKERKTENDNMKNYVTESMIFHSLNNNNNKEKVDPREEKRKFWESCRKNESVRRFKWGDRIKPLRMYSPLTTVGSSESLSEQTCTKYETKTKIERSKSCEPNDWSGSNPFFADVFPPEPIQNEIKIKSYNPFTINEQLSSFDFGNDTVVNDQHRENKCSFASKKELQFNEKSFEMKDIAGNISKEIKESSKTTLNDLQSKNSKENFNVKCEFFEKATSVPITCVNENAKGLVEARLKEGSNSCPSSSFHWPTVQATTDIDSENMSTISKTPQFETPTKEKSFYASPTRKIPAQSNLKKPSDFIAMQRNSPVELGAASGTSSTNTENLDNEMYEIKEHKKKTITQSSYEKIIRERGSPYENVESSCRREFKQEELIRPFSRVNMKDRSSTPSGFYDNFEQVYHETRSRSPAVCVQSDSFEEIRTKVGSLLGGIPLVWRERPTAFYPAEKCEQAIEQAFQELAAKEGLIDDISSLDSYYDQFE